MKRFKDSEMTEMSDLLATCWKKTLTSIVEELDKSQYKTMMEFLHKIPKSQKTPRYKEQIPQIIIEHYGEEESISAIKQVMDDLPRNDSAIRSLLAPFLDKLEKKKRGKKRKREGDAMSAAGFKKNNIVSYSESSDEEKEAETGFKKNNIVSDSESSGEEEEAEPDDLKSDQSDQEKKIPAWRNSISYALTSRDTESKPVAGKVVQKSGLRTYQTKTKEKKFFFYLGVADETGALKVMVYGKERFRFFQEGSFYIFRHAIMENDIMKVTKKTKTSKTAKFNVPDHLEENAKMLVYSQSPVCSIEEAKSSDDKTLLSVEGKITEIGAIESVKVKTKRTKTKKLEFELKDDSGTIWIILWGDDIKVLQGKSNGDLVRVINVRNKHYYDTVSLNSTVGTQIVKKQKAAVQNVHLQIIGIIKAGKIQTELDVGINGQVDTFVVASPLLAKVVGVRLDGNFEEKLLEKLPFSGKAEIQGNKIKQLAAADEM